MPNKILIIGPAWIGDMVMAQSLFKLLKLVHPHATIDVLAPAWTFSLLSAMPEVSEAIEMPLKHGEFKLATRYQIGKKLGDKKYDLAIVLQNSFKSALLPFFARIPQRRGWLGECRYILLNDARRLDKKRYPLMIEQFMALALPANAALPTVYPYPEFSISEEMKKAAVLKFALATERPILALGAGAAFGPAKRWPAEYFAELAKQKMAEGWDVWLFGAAGDKPIIDTIQQITENRCKDISGKTELSETLALLAAVSGVVTNDSGLMHMAAALKKPVIVIYGPSSPSFTPPLSKTAKILKLDLECQPCFERECPLIHHRCMRDVKPVTVLTEMLDWGVEA